MKKLIDTLIEAIVGPFIRPPAPKPVVVPVHKPEKGKVPWKG